MFPQHTTSRDQRESRNGAEGEEGKVKGGRKGGQKDRHRAGAQIIVVRSAPHTHHGNTRAGKAGVASACVEGEDRDRQGVCTPELANARAFVRQHMQ